MEGDCTGYEIVKREEDGLYVFYWQDEFGGNWSTDLLGNGLEQGVFETYEQAEAAANDYFERR